ncbi:TIGR04255 family protein [Candidatus Neomarinimicrobiota bacterium]
MVSTKELDSIRYVKNCLSEVIVRIDLVSPIAELDDSLPKDVSREALRRFPINEPKPIFTQEVLVSEKELQTRKHEFMEWNFFGKSREKRLALTRDAFFISYKHYDKYENLRDDFINVATSFFKDCPQAQPSRLGLRYINEFMDLPGSDVFDWREYIDESLLGLLAYKVEGSEPSRIFHNYETVFPEGFNLRFRFGIHNPDYPAPIRRRVFILDYDAHHKGLLEQADVPIALDNYHREIQRLFEKSITDRTRKVLNEKE